MDLLPTLPNFPAKPYAHILPSLEKNRINTVDLITLDTLEIAKRAHVPAADVRRLSTQVIEALHRDVGFVSKQSTTAAAAAGFDDDELAGLEPEPELELSSSIDSSIETTLEPGPSTKLDLEKWSIISTLDPALDALLGGGIPTGYVTEVTGESGSGKTQFLLSLLLSVQLPRPRGLGRRAIYISTEAPLPTLRLSQLLKYHPYLSSLPPGRSSCPSLQNILSINAMDLETQDHILNYQLPVAVARYDVGLVVIDSITANYRAEHASDNVGALSARSGELAKLGQMLRNLAVKERIAIVVANQVSDRFESFENGTAASVTAGQRVNARDSGATLAPLPRNRSDGTRYGSGNAELSSHPPPTADTMLPPSSSPAAAGTPSSQNIEEDPQFDGSYLVGNPVRNDILSLLHQQRFFTGWGDDVPSSQYQYSSPTRGFAPFPHSKPSHKTPALGFVWSTQIACRIALKKKEEEAVLKPGPGTLDVPAQTAQTSEQAFAFASASTGDSNSNDDNAHDNEPTETVPKPFQRLPPSSQDSRPSSENRFRRMMKLVFAPWTDGAATVAGGSGKYGGGGGEGGGGGDQVDFEIWKGGVRSLRVD